MPLCMFWGRGPKTKPGEAPLKKHSRSVGVMAIVAGRENTRIRASCKRPPPPYEPSGRYRTGVELDARNLLAPSSSKTRRWWRIVVLAAAPWLRWRFSLRTLLIATTLIAVLLGIIVWKSRTG